MGHVLDVQQVVIARALRMAAVVMVRKLTIPPSLG